MSQRTARERRLAEAREWARQRAESKREQSLEDHTGEVQNGRRVLRTVGVTKYAGRKTAHRVLVICEGCGAVGETDVRSFRSRGCGRCNSSTAKPLDPESLSPVARLLLEAVERCPEVWANEMPGDMDIVCEALSELGSVLGPHRAHVDGFSHEEVGALLRVSRQRAAQIEEVAKKKARLKGGAELREYAEHLDERGSDWTWWAA